MSMNKVTVVKKYGTSSRVGYASPDVGMVTNKGEITAVATNGIVSVGTGTEGRYTVRAHRLEVLDSNVTNWPNDADHVENTGHLPNGPDLASASARAYYYSGSDGKTSS